MGFSRNFGLGLGLRVLALVGAILALIYTLSAESLVAARFVAATMFAAAFYAIIAFVQRTNLETARFVETIGFGDFSQRFAGRFSGSGAAELGEALEGAIRKLRDERAQLSDESRYLAALVDEAPTALLTIDEEGRVELANKAARRLFRRREGGLLPDLAPYGDEFVTALEAARPGRTRLTRIVIDGVAQRATLRAAGAQRQGGSVRVVTVQPIQGELNAVEIAAQTDLVRVLTHEIMNSMTPVTSLAQTAAALMRSVDAGGDRDVSDARVAVETLAARAEGIMHFVESYRQFSRAPVVHARAFDAAPWAEEMRRLFAAAAYGVRVPLALDIADGAQLDADPELMSQVVLNLLKNGAEAAAAAGAHPALRLAIERTASGRTLIAVEDNGPGIAPARRDEVFLPFFTTKASGTGVGLSLARQIVVAHAGTIAVEDAPSGGARFTILL